MERSGITSDRERQALHDEDSQSLRPCFRTLKPGLRFREHDGMFSSHIRVTMPLVREQP